MRCGGIEDEAMLTERVVPANEPVKKSSQFPVNRDSLELWTVFFAGS